MATESTAQASKQRNKGGRPPGSPNKVSAQAKENIIAVFTRIGGTAGMAKWAEKNRTDFYRIYAKLLPVELSSDADAPITVVFRDATARPEGYERRRKG